MSTVGNRGAKAMLTALLVVITLVMVFPFVWMVLFSFKTNTELYNAPLALPENFNLDNYRRALQTVDLPRLYGNTLWVASVSVVVGMVITFMSSFALSRMVFRKRLVRGLLHKYLLMGLMIPPFILLFPVYRFSVSAHLYGTFWALILPYIATQISFNTLLFVGFFNGLPGEVEEAAIIDGCNLAQLCLWVVVPMAKAVISTVFIFNVLYVWNEYPFASILIPKTEMATLSMGASFFKGLYSVDYVGITASSLLIIVPQLIFFGFFQRSIVAGMTAGAVKG